MSYNKRVNTVNHLTAQDAEAVAGILDLVREQVDLDDPKDTLNKAQVLEAAANALKISAYVKTGFTFPWADIAKMLLVSPLKSKIMSTDTRIGTQDLVHLMLVNVGLDVVMIEGNHRDGLWPGVVVQREEYEEGESEDNQQDG